MRRGCILECPSWGGLQTLNAWAEEMELCSQEHISSLDLPRVAVHVLQISSSHL